MEAINPADLRTSVFAVGGYYEADGSVSPYGGGIRIGNIPVAANGSHHKVGDVNHHFLQPAHVLGFRVVGNGVVKTIDFQPAGVTDKIIYLPYFQKNITSARIPASDASVRFFITDQLSGCNVFIDQLPNRDLVCYHANALQHSPTEQQVKADAGVFHPLAPTTMSAQHAAARKAYPGAVNVAVLRVSDYYAKAQPEVDRKLGQGRTDINFWGGTTIMGFRIAGSWQFWFQTYARLEYKRTGLAGLFKGKTQGVANARYRILEARRFWP